MREQRRSAPPTWKSLSDLLRHRPVDLVSEDDPNSPEFFKRLGERLRGWLVEIHPEVAGHLCVFDFLLSDIRTRRFYGTMLFPKDFDDEKYTKLLRKFFENDETVGSHLVFQAGLPWDKDIGYITTYRQMKKMEDHHPSKEGYLSYSFDQHPDFRKSPSSGERGGNGIPPSDNTLKFKPVSPTDFLRDKQVLQWQNEASKKSIFDLWEEFCQQLGDLDMKDINGRSLSVFYGLPLVLLSAENRPTKTQPVGAAFIGLSRGLLDPMDCDEFLRSFYLYASRSVAAQHSGHYDRAQTESDILHRLPSNFGAIRNALLLKNPELEIPLSFNALYLWTCLAKFRSDSTIEVPEWGEIEDKFEQQDGFLVITKSAIEQLIREIARPIARSRRLQSGESLFEMSPAYNIECQTGFVCGSETEARGIIGAMLIMLQEGFQHAWSLCTEDDPLLVDITETSISVMNPCSNDMTRANYGRQCDELFLLCDLLNKVSSEYEYAIKYLVPTNNHRRSDISTKTKTSEA